MRRFHVGAGWRTLGLFGIAAGCAPAAGWDYAALVALMNPFTAYLMCKALKPLGRLIVAGDVWLERRFPNPTEKIEPKENPYAKEEARLQAIVREQTEALGVAKAPLVSVKKSEEKNACLNNLTNEISVTSGLMGAFSEREIKTVVGHEMGHFMMNKNKSYIWGRAAALFCSGLMSAVAALESQVVGNATASGLYQGLMLGATILGLSAIRHEEHVADDFGLLLSGDLEAALSAEEKLQPTDAKKHFFLRRWARAAGDWVYENAGGWLLGTHPTCRARKRSMKRYAKRIGLDCG